MKNEKLKMKNGTTPMREPTARRRSFLIFYFESSTLLALPLIAYLPALRHGGFVWDDFIMLVGNPTIKAADGLDYIWGSTRLPDYFPLTSASLWLEWRVW